MAGIIAALALANTALATVKHVQDLIQKATHEGRDITPEELAAARQRDADERAAWESTLPSGGSIA